MNTIDQIKLLESQIREIRAIIATQDCDYKVQYNRLYSLEQKLLSLKETNENSTN